jgi:cysteine synthase
MRFPKPGDLNVFSGRSAVQDFLNPECSPPLPLVELPGALNPLQDEKVRIFAKIVYLTPLFNIKWYASLNLLLDAQASGKLDGIHTIVESSSGNKVLADAILARMFGIPNIVAIVPSDIPAGKLEVLRLFGVNVEYIDRSAGQPSGIAKARDMGQQRGFFNPAQYDNDANPVAYEKWLAPEIWRQTEGRVTVLCAGLGTTGTIVGASRYLREKSPRTRIVGVACRPDEAVPGVRSIRRLEEVKHDWRAAIDHLVEIGTKESYQKSLALCRIGLLAGPSSGFALAGLVAFLEARQASSALDELRNDDGEIVAIVVCPDPALLYLDQYAEHLEPPDLALDLAPSSNPGSC